MAHELEGRAQTRMQSHGRERTCWFGNQHEAEGRIFDSGVMGNETRHSGCGQLAWAFNKDSVRSLDSSTVHCMEGDTLRFGLSVVCRSLGLLCG